LNQETNMTSKFAVFWRLAIGISLVFGFGNACSTDEPVATQYKRGQAGSGSGSGSGTQNRADAAISVPSPATGVEDLTREQRDSLDANNDQPVNNNNQPPAPPPVDPAQVQAQLVQEGTNIYTQRCAGCHTPIANSTKRGRTAAQISAAQGIMPHAGLQWPNQQEALALEAALKNP